MLKRYKIVNDKVVESTDEQGPILVYIQPDNGEKHNLVDNYSIDKHTLHSALDSDELAWLEFEPNHIAIIFKRPRNYSGKDQLLFKSSTMGMFLFSERLIVVLPEDIPLFDEKLFTKVASLKDVLLKLIYCTIIHFIRHLKVINMISDELEQKINKAMENKYLINLFTLQKSLVYYQDAINSNNFMIEKLKLNSVKLGLVQEHLELLEDIIVENSQCYKQAEIYSNVLASLMDARASVVSNNLNILMKVLNIVVIALMVPTLVVSIFSMNVRLPMQNLPNVFWTILGLSAVSASIVLLIWKLRKL